MARPELCYFSKPCRVASFGGQCLHRVQSEIYALKLEKKGILKQNPFAFDGGLLQKNQFTFIFASKDDVLFCHHRTYSPKNCENFPLNAHINQSYIQKHTNTLSNTSHIYHQAHLRRTKGRFPIITYYTTGSSFTSALGVR